MRTLSLAAWYATSVRLVAQEFPHCLPPVPVDRYAAFAQAVTASRMPADARQVVATMTTVHAVARGLYRLDDLYAAGADNRVHETAYALVEAMATDLLHRIASQAVGQYRLPRRDLDLDSVWDDVQQLAADADRAAETIVLAYGLDMDMTGPLSAAIADGMLANTADLPTFVEQVVTTWTNLDDSQRHTATVLVVHDRMPFADATKAATLL